MIAQPVRPMYDQRKWMLGKIHEVATLMKIDDASRRAWQLEFVGVESCKDMDNLQLKKVLNALTHHTKAGKPPRTDKQYVLRSGRDERMPDEPVTIEQKHMIDALFADIEVQNPGRLARDWRTGFCKRQIRCVWPQTRAQANKITEALKAMRDRHWHPKEKPL